MKRAYVSCSLQYFGGKLKTRDLKAQGSVEYYIIFYFPMTKVAHLLFRRPFRPKMYEICDFCDLPFF